MVPAAGSAAFNFQHGGKAIVNFLGLLAPPQSANPLLQPPNPDTRGMAGGCREEKREMGVGDTAGEWTDGRTDRRVSKRAGGHRTDG